MSGAPGCRKTVWTSNLRGRWARIDRAGAQRTGNKGRAAGLLGMKRTTLVEKLKRMNVK